MSEQEKINKLVHEAMHSLDDVHPVAGKPYLFTRINAKMQQQPISIWDNVLAFISKPVVAVACAVLIIAINIAVLVNTNDNGTEENYSTADEYNSEVIAYNDIENFESQ